MYFLGVLIHVTVLLLGSFSNIIAMEDGSKLSIAVGNHDQSFDAYLPQTYKRQQFKGYFVELDEITGCGDNVNIKYKKENESNENTYITYINWYGARENLCQYNEVVRNLKNASIEHFVLIIPYDESDNLMHHFNIEEKSDMSFVILSRSDNRADELMDLTSTEGNLRSITVSIVNDGEESTSIPMSSMAILFVTVAFVTLMTVSIGWLVFYYAQRCRQRNMRERLQSRLCVAAKRAVSKLPTKVVPDNPKNGKRAKKTSPSPDNDRDSTCSSCSSDEGDFCPVCLDLYKPREVIRILPCKHEFHKSCVDPWLFDHRTCPMCKLDILEHLGMPSGGDRLVIPAISNPPEPSDINMSTRVDQEVQTDFINNTPHHVIISDEIAPAPISPPAIS